VTEGSIFEVNPCLLVAYFVPCDVRMYRGVGGDEESGRSNMGQLIKSAGILTLRFAMWLELLTPIQRGCEPSIRPDLNSNVIFVRLNPFVLEYEAASPGVLLPTFRSAVVPSSWKDLYYIRLFTKLQTVRRPQTVISQQNSLFF